MRSAGTARMRHSRGDDETDESIDPAEDTEPADREATTEFLRARETDEAATEDRARAATREALDSALENAPDEPQPSRIETADPEAIVADVCDCDATIEELVSDRPDLAAVVEQEIRLWQLERATARAATALREERRRMRAAAHATRPRPQRADHAESSIIVVIGHPPAREGTHRAARYACLRTGMTVGEYLDAAYRAAPQRPRYKRHADVIRLENEGYIRVSPAPGAEDDGDAEDEARSMAA